MRVITYALLSCALLCTCSSAVKRDTWVEFALSTPDHLSDWQEVRTKLQAEGIECSENASSLGTFSCSVTTDNFDHAKEIVVALVRSNSLTVRVKKQKDSELFEIYRQGKKVTEETYVVK
jgi:hypothetical protein